MKKKPASSSRPATKEADLFARVERRRRRALFLLRFLSEEANTARLRGKAQDQAYQIVCRWAELEAKGHPRRKETSVDAHFLRDVFGDALGYKPATESPERYGIERQFPVPEIGRADAALGQFGPGVEPSPAAVIELKGAHIDLDRDKSNGRTAVQ